MNRFLLAGLLTIIIANVFIMGHVAWNRGSPQNTLKFSERELAPLPGWRRIDENSGISLQLEVRVLGARSSPYNYRRALPTADDKLGEFGFKSNCNSSYFVATPRAAWFALEFDGDMLKQQAKLDERALRAARDEAEKASDPQKKKSAEEYAKRLAKSQKEDKLYGSRLFIKDVDRERAPLARLYAGKPNVVITRGSVTCSDGQLQLRDLDARNINVPKQFRSVVAGLDYNYQDHAPRYSADVAFGRLGEPWITDLKSL